MAQPSPFFSQNVGNVSASNGSRIFIGTGAGFREQDALPSLPFAAQAAFDHGSKEHHPSCLQGTRTAVLQRVRDWMNRDDEASHILWLSGMAGTGKSTIARTLAREFSERDILGASFFFARDVDEVANAGLFFTTIARQLASKFPEVRAAISKVLGKEPDVASKMKRDQWEKLIVTPLNGVAPKPGRDQETTIVVVIDALDECDSEKDAVNIISLLAKANDVRSVRISFIVTSRPETAIRAEFRRPEIVHQPLVLDDEPGDDVAADIRKYFCDGFERLRRERDWLPSDWPGEQIIDRLVASADNLFIFASTVYLSVSESSESPDDSLAVFLDQAADGINDQSSNALHLMYDNILRKAIPNSSRVRETMISVLGAVAALSDPLSAPALANLLGEPVKNVYQSLNGLHSVVRVPSDARKPIYLCHASFRDFLLEPNRHADFCQQTIHDRLATACLNLLSRQLHRDMCSVKEPGYYRGRISPQDAVELITEEASYACRHWVNHVEQSSREHLQDGGQAHQLLATKLLYWIEVLAWLDDAAGSVLRIRTLRQLAAPGGQVAALLEDAYRFALQNWTTIDVVPLQIYCSGLVFCPIQSIIRRLFQDDVLLRLKALPFVPASWGQELFKLAPSSQHQKSFVFSEIHRQTTTEYIAISPDGQCVVSISQINRNFDGFPNKLFHMWDTVTGKSISQTNYMGLSEQRSLVAGFVGNSIFKALIGYTICTWDLDAGELTTKALLADPQQSQPQLAASSFDFKILALYWIPNLVQTYDIDGNLISEIRPAGIMKAMSVTSDERRIACASSFNASTYDLKTGQHLTCNDFRADASFLGISSSGRFVALARGSYWVEVREIATNRLIQLVEHSGDQPNASTKMAFSADETMLVTVRQNVIVWKLSTGEATQRYEDDLGHPLSVLFTPDGTRVAIRLQDQTIRIWDIGSPQILAPRWQFDPTSALLARNDGTITSRFDGYFSTGVRDAQNTSRTPANQSRHVVHDAALSPNSKVLLTFGRVDDLFNMDHPIQYKNKPSGLMYACSRDVSNQDHVLAPARNGTRLSTIIWDEQDLSTNVWFAPDDFAKGRKGNGEAIEPLPESNLYSKSWRPGLVIQRIDGRGLYTNRAFQEMFGVELPGVNDAGIMSQGMCFSPAKRRTQRASAPIRRIRINDRWVTCDGQRVLWIPLDYEARYHSFHGNTLTLLHSSDRLSLLEFDLPENLSKNYIYDTLD